MGSGSSSDSKKKSSPQRPPDQKKKHNLPDQVLELLRRSLMSLPFQVGLIDEQILNIAAQNVERIELVEPEVILTKGEVAKGIYILIDGEAQVVSSSGSIIANLSDGELFGELSTLYDLPCTATVKTTQKVIMLVLKIDALKMALKDRMVPTSLMDYYVKKRYLDTSGAVSQSELMQRIVEAVLKEVPLFKHWEDAAVQSLIKSIQQDGPIVTLAPSDSVIAMAGDPVDEIVIIIKGRVEVFQEKELLSTLDSTKWPVWHGEEGLFTGRQSSASVKTLSACQLVIIKNAHVVETVKQYKQETTADFTKKMEKWKQRAARSDPAIEAHYPVEVLIQKLSKTRFLSDVPLDGLYSIAINSKTIAHQVGSTVIGDGASQLKSKMMRSEGRKPTDPPSAITPDVPPGTAIQALDIPQVFWADDVLILMLKGEAILNGNEEWTCEEGDVLWVPQKVRPNSKLEAKHNSVILQFTGSALDEACRDLQGVTLAVPSTVR
ncbi:uncharacterized protein [Asterias amurensis]|uniref:uncharacterized protein n=1 Tax=Asterias amurensis TaxID=7602 RepID=UPI003AB4E3CC